MRKLQATAIIALLFIGFPERASAQGDDRSRPERLPAWGVKTNLLYDATATVNLGVEFRTGRKTSFDIPFNYNPWTFSRDRKWKHFLAQPEFRWWTREAFRGHFLGLHGHYALYNISRLPHSPFSEHMESHRFEGWLAGAGVSYGYRWNLDRHWALEATIGIGYAYLSYDTYNCGRCGERAGGDERNYLGPTKAGVTLIYGIGGKRAAKPRPAPVYVAPSPEPAPVTPPIPYEPKFNVSLIIPEAEAVKQRDEAGKAYLDFAAGRSEIVPGLANNADELRKIQALIESVKNNPDATITAIEITGYASPEGAHVANGLLSGRRARALKEYIQSVYGSREDLFDVRGAGEDWATLDTLVARSDLALKHQVLEVIRDNDPPDARERKLSALSGGVYRQLLAGYYPRLRRSDCRVSYTVPPFTIEKGKEVLRTRPANLSLSEMFLIANTYAPGSDAYHEAIETAARVFPDSDVANINAAASALERKDADAAARYLSRVKQRDGAYWNNMGALAWARGDKREAAECFAKGGQRGAGNAAELSKHIRSIITQ